MVRERPTTVCRSRGEPDERIAFKKLKSFKPFKPSPLSSPASRGRIKEGEYVNAGQR
jgi:hypothetical protein